MDDKTIVDLYWQRDEKAIAATRDKYGRYCYAIAYGILHSAPQPSDADGDDDRQASAGDRAPADDARAARLTVGVIDKIITDQADGVLQQFGVLHTKIPSFSR